MSYSGGVIFIGQYFLADYLRKVHEPLNSIYDTILGSRPSGLKKTRLMLPFVWDTLDTFS